MRLGFVSDIHGNLPALEACLAAFDAMGVDEVVCLGDVVDLGPEPGAVTDLLRERRIPTILGNHDPLDEHPTMPFLSDIERWTEEVLTDDQRAWLTHLPEALVYEHGGKRLLAVHGSPRRNTDGVLADTPADILRAWCAGHDFDVLVSGHAHVQTVRRLDGRTFVNVGSIGMPFLEPFGGKPPVGLPWAELAIVTLGSPASGAPAPHVGVELLQLPYDVDRFLRAVRESGMPHADTFLSQWRLS